MSAKTEIEKAYRTYKTQTGREWMSLTEITHRTDLKISQIHEALRDLVRTDPKIEVSTRIDQISLTDEDRANRVVIGGEPIDQIAW